MLLLLISQAKVSPHVHGQSQWIGKNYFPIWRSRRHCRVTWKLYVMIQKSVCSYPPISFAKALKMLQYQEGGLWKVIIQVIDLDEVMRVSLNDEISALIRRKRDLQTSCLCHVRTQQKDSFLQARQRSFTRTKSASTLVFPVFRTAKNKCLLFKLHCLQCFLIAARAD